MKVSRIFAGLLIILLGLALFLSNFDVLSLDWHFIFRLWPVLLVFAGISVLVTNPKLKALLYAVTAILVLVWIFSVASVGWGNFRGLFHGAHGPTRHQEFSQDLEKDIHHGVLSLNSGAGSFTLDSSTDKLFEADAESNMGNYTLDADKEGTIERLDLNFQEDKDYHWRFGSNRNEVGLKLNPDVDWRLEMNVGACSVNFDLSNFSVRSADIKAGASSVKLTLGDKADTTNVSVNTGASSVKIYVPKSSGCEVRDGARLSSKSFQDLVKVGGDVYRSSNFESAKKKIFVDVDAGVSSIRISNY